jgi:uncharacterized membrane protein YvbJ
MEKQPDEIYCPECGDPVKRKAKFCPNCGAQLKDTKPQNSPIAIDRRKDQIKKEPKLSGGTIMCGIVFGIEVLSISGILPGCLFRCILM